MEGPWKSVTSSMECCHYDPEEQTCLGGQEHWRGIPNMIREQLEELEDYFRYYADASSF